MSHIIIASQSLECNGQLRVERFGLPSTKSYDGIHMRGKLAVQHYTASMINVMLDVFAGPGEKKINLEHNQSHPQVNQGIKGHNQGKNNYHRNNHGSPYNGGRHQHRGQYTQNSWTGQNTLSGLGSDNMQSGNNQYYKVETSNMFTASGN